MANKTILILAFIAFYFSNRELSSAAPLEEARVTKIVNEVKLIDPSSGKHAAKLEDVVRGDLALTTGIKSRSELLFQDNTLTRIGPESYFSFKTGTRDMTLEKGTMLLQVPKGIGGARIHTAAITAAITGTTIMMEYTPGKDIKVLVLEGTLRLMNGRFGDSLLLTPGRMVIMPPNARRIPDPVTVDLKKVVQTSTLVNMKSGKKGNTEGSTVPPLPSMPLIEKQIQLQQSGKDSRNLIETNLVILGKGTNVLLGSDDLLHDIASRTDAAKQAPIPDVQGAATPDPTPNPNPTPNANPPPTGTPTPPPSLTYITDNATKITTQSNSATIATQGVTNSGVIYKNLQTNGSPSGFLLGASSAFDNAVNFDNFYQQKFHQSAVFVFDSLQLGGGLVFSINGGTNNVALVGNNGITNSAGSSITLSNVNNLLFATQAGNIALDSGISFIASGDKPQLVQFYARGGDVQIGSTFNLPKAALQFVAENNAIFDSNASVTAKNLTVTGLQTVQFDGSATVSSVFQLNGGDVEIGGNVTAKDSFLFGTSATINGTLGGGSLTATISGDFLLAASGSLTGSEKLEINASGIAQFNGSISAPNADVNVSGVATLPNTPGIIVNGNLTAKSFDFKPVGDFLLNSSGNLTSSGNLKVDATNGAITLDGSISVHDAKLTAANDVAVNHAISTGNLTIDGQNETIAAAVTGNDLKLDAVGNVTLTSAGSLNSQNHKVSVTAGGNIDIAGLVTGNDSDFHPAGNFTLENTGLFNLNGHLKIDSGQMFTIAGAVAAHDVDLHSSADTDLTSTGSFDLSGHLHIDAGGNITLGGVTNVSNDIHLNANNTVTVNGVVTANSNFNAQANAVLINNNIIAQSMTFQTPTLSLTNSGSLTATNNIQINNATSISLDGTVAATNNLNLTASGDVEIGASTQAGNTTVHSGTFTLNGNLTGATVNLQLSTGLNSGAAGSLVSAQTLSINVPTAFTFNTTDSTKTRFDLTNLSSLTINAQSIAFNGDVTVSGNNSDLTATSGGIDATGHQLSGFDQVSLTNGDLIAGGLSANKLTLHQSGNITITNDLVLNQSLSAPGTVNVGGLFSVQSATAASDVSANALHTNNLTSSGAFSLGSGDLAPFSGNNLAVTAQSLSFAADVTLSSVTANLTATNGDIDATGHQLSSFNSISVTNGNVLSSSLSATSLNLNDNGIGAVLSGNVVLSNSVAVTAQTLTVNGSVTAPTMTLQLGSGLNPGAAGSLISGQNVSITVPAVFTFNTADATTTRFDTTNLSTLSINAQSIVFNGDVTVSGNNSDLTATSGGIDATGHQLSGFDQVSLTNGDLVAGGLSGNKLTLHQSGNITITNDLVLNQSLSAPGTVSVGGLLSVQSVTAASDVSANALHTNNLTSSGIFSLGSGDLAPFSGNNLAVTAQSLSFAADVTLSSVIANLTATNGDIDATGHQLSGFNSILASGNLTAASVSTNALSVGGTLTAGSINAINTGTVTANALHADSVTANNSVTVNSSDLAPYSSNTISINAPNISLPAGAVMDGQNGTPIATPGNAFNLALAATNFTLNSPISLTGGDGDVSVADAGGNGGQLDVSGNNITANAPITATTGQNSNSGLTGGNGGTVNLTAQKTVTVNNKIEVSSNDGNRRRSARGGNINITSNATSGTAISVSSSAQLLALLDAAAPGPGGRIKLVAAGGNINMNGTAQADRGAVEITNNGASGAIALTNATLAADTVKVGALGTNGTLTIGGGTISADSIIKLYAGGSNGTVLFTNDVTLSGNAAKTIAANTVTINNGRVVTILGPTVANVFTNNPNYTGFGGNSLTTGTFGGQGATTSPLAGAPGY